MSDHLGIKISPDAAQVLVQSAKTNIESDKGLSIDEFQNLIFACEDQLKVDLSLLQPYDKNTASKPPTGHSTKTHDDHSIEN